MKLNLGNGNIYVQGWHNVDHALSPHPRDETVDLTGALPWKPASIVHVYAGHVLEHLTQDQCLKLLTNLLPCMAKFGKIMVVGPDMELARAMDVTPWHTLDEIIHGGRRWPGDEHQWECTTDAVMELLNQAGWQKITNVGITNVDSWWPVADRGPRWQLAVTARA